MAKRHSGRTLCPAQLRLTLSQMEEIHILYMQMREAMERKEWDGSEPMMVITPLGNMISVAKEVE